MSEGDGRAPSAYEASLAFWNRIGDLPDSLERDAYEAACQEFGVTASPDAEIRRRGYFVKFMGASQDEQVWKALARRRLRALDDAATATPAPAPPLDAQARIAPAGTTVGEPDYGPCRICREPDSAWNPGSGSYLCDRHWDIY